MIEENTNLQSPKQSNFIVRQEAGVYEDVVRDQLRLNNNESPNLVEQFVLGSAMLRAKI